MKSIKKFENKRTIDVFDHDSNRIGFYEVFQSCKLFLLNEVDDKQQLYYREINMEPNGDIHLISGGADFHLRKIARLNSKIPNSVGYLDKTDRVFWLLER
jgi:hypothetical protein